MKVAILAGGVGSRLSPETDGKPKPLVEIGGRPILWHIMQHFSHYGLRDFVIALGYRGEAIKHYMSDYARLHGNLSINMRTGVIEQSGAQVEDWQVDLVDTGEKTQTGGRIKRLREWLGNETFLLAWGDGVHTIDITALLHFHRDHGRLATVTAVRPPARFGHLEFAGDQVVEFSEKPQTAEGWINGGLFVLEPGIFDVIDGDDTAWEREPMERLSSMGELMAFRHSGFWQCMDTPRDHALLNRLWHSDAAPWRLG
ncbi:MAG: glucose-1-phosphate cytidylyltransferase [Halieaceae bacterium]|jgi:glucose-1-phosphate cytidylyltransferase|nr:glucose-1-phosphate cytidylyltransferase [Halieaceae bacterium]